MSTACYQRLVDRCWRRSGNLLYRPNQKDACCPHYPLRVDSTSFRATKDQRQAVNRFNRFIIGIDYARVAARRYPKSREQARKRSNEFDLVERIHECESLARPPEPAHSFVVTLEPDDFTEEKYAVFEDYQRVIHGEDPSDISRDGFTRFLCNSPLRKETITMSSGREKRLGSFHQCYRLGGKLVAVGVLDLLPEAVSAVYLFYHQSIHDWNPGKLGALREIALAREGEYRWWYPGYYIQTCPKMRYKMDYAPQQILNPNNMEWMAITKELLSRFDSYGYLHFPGFDENGATGPDLEQPSPTVRGEIEASVNEEETEEKVDNGAQGDNEDDDADISLFKSKMPGLAPLSDVLSYNYDELYVRHQLGYFLAKNVFDWDDEDAITGSGPKAQLARLAASVGPDLMPQLCLDLRRPY
ncbi:arginine-tRNA-protein transferase [Poronia punctata]|nr:arginine-tRNA-protein transferase [Poronia punctata]